MVSAPTDSQLLTMDFLQARLKQAESDVSMYQLMIQELAQLVENSNKTKKQTDFLRVIVNKEMIQGDGNDELGR